MALMGLSFDYSRHTEFKYGIQRGLWLILLGYILNLLRGVLPIVYVNLLSPSRAAQIPDAVANLTDAFWSTTSCNSPDWRSSPWP
jgi:hypothetical protein